MQPLAQREHGQQVEQRHGRQGDDHVAARDIGFRGVGQEGDASCEAYSGV
jgi:hypothetical protein